MTSLFAGHEDFIEEETVQEIGYFRADAATEEGFQVEFFSSQQSVG